MSMPISFAASWNHQDLVRLRAIFGCHEPQHGAGSRSKPHAWTTGSQDHHQKFGSRGVGRGEICQGTGLPHLSAGSRSGSLFGERPGVWAVSERRFCVFLLDFLAFRNTTDVSWSPKTLIACLFECEAFPLCNDLAALRCFECSEVPRVEVASSRQHDPGAWQDQHLPGHCPKQRVGVSGRARKIASEFRSCKSDFAFDSGNPGMASSRAQEPVAEACQRFTVRQVERLRCFIERHFPRILGSQFGTLRRVVLRFCSESTGGVFATVLGEFEAEFRRLCSDHRCISPSIDGTTGAVEAEAPTSWLRWLQEPDWCRLWDSGTRGSIRSIRRRMPTDLLCYMGFVYSFVTCVSWDVTVCHSYIDWYIIDIGHSLTHFETPQRHCISVGYTVTCCGPLAHLRSTLGWSLQGFACWPLRFTSRTSLSWSSTSLAAFDFTAQVFLNCRRTCLLPFAASKEASREQQSIGTFKTSAISRNSRWNLHLLQMNFDDDNYKYVINVVSLWCMWYTDFSIALAKHDNCQTAGCLKKELRAAEPDFVSLVMRVAISNTFQPEIFQHLLLRITLHLRFCNIFMTWSSCDQLLSEHWPRLAHGELGRRVGDPGGLLKTSEVHWSLASIRLLKSIGVWPRLTAVDCRAKITESVGAVHPCAAFWRPCCLNFASSLIGGCHCAGTARRPSPSEKKERKGNADAKKQHRGATDGRFLCIGAAFPKRGRAPNHGMCLGPLWALPPLQQD